MCGFNGIVTRGSIPTLGKIEQCQSFIQRRGPDYSGISKGEKDGVSWTYHHTRLSILDLSILANQPFIKDDIILLFNGEIYNYSYLKKELESLGHTFRTDSDTEVIIEAYKQWSERAFTKFTGMFSIALHDKTENSLVLARDRAGVKPLYYMLSEETLVFSSDLYAVKSMSGKSLTLEDSAISRFLNVGYNDLGTTYFKEVRQVDPGTFVVVNLSKMTGRETVYWDPSRFYSIQKNLIDDNLIKDLEDLLIDSVRLRMVSDVPVGLFLSGGYDSSLVAALLAKKLDNPIKSYTVGFENSFYDESTDAKRIAEYLGIQNQTITATTENIKDLIIDLPDVYDVPFGDSSAIPTLLVSKLASNDVKVVLSADGGDEYFAGYSRYIEVLRRYQQLDTLPSVVRNILAKLPDHVIKEGIGFFMKRNLTDLNVEKFKTLVKTKSLSDFYSVYTSTNAFSLGEKFIIPKNRDFNGLNTLLLHDYNNYLQHDILKKVDRATMYYSIEGREPLLDHRIFEFMGKVNPQLKLKGNVSKYLLKEVVYKYIPKELIDKPKKGFSIPLGNIIHEDDDLLSLFMDTLSPVSLKSLDMLDSNLIVEQMNHFYKNPRHGFIPLWYVFNLVRWNDKMNRI